MFVILGQPPKPTQPREGPLDDPAPWEQHEPLAGLGELDDLQPDAPARCLGVGISPSVALINVGNLDCVAVPSWNASVSTATCA